MRPLEAHINLANLRHNFQYLKSKHGNKTLAVIKANAYGLGVSYGYAWMLSKRWNIALEAGIGLFHTEDTRRDPTVSDWEDEYIYRYRRWTLAPTKLEVSFSYIF